jgi:hypothetical protein
VCKPLIEVRFEANFYPLSKAFQRYVARYSYKQGNQGDSQHLVVESQIANFLLAMLLAITCVSGTQTGHANPF